MKHEIIQKRKNSLIVKELGKEFRSLCYLASAISEDKKRDRILVKRQTIVPVISGSSVISDSLISVTLASSQTSHWALSEASLK